VREARRLRELAQRRPVQQVDARASVRALAQPRGRVRLRVEIDHERALAGFREAGCEVDRGRRLADSALLVGDRKSARAHAASLRVAADVSRTPIANGGLSEWALLRYTGTAREARGRPRQLLEHEQTRELFGWSAAEALRDAADGLGVRAQPDEQDDRSGHSDQRQAPLHPTVR